MQMTKTGDIEVYISNNERFQYDNKFLKTWKQMPEYVTQGKSQDFNEVRVEPAHLQFEGSVN